MSFLDKIVNFIKKHSLVALNKKKFESSYETELKRYLSCMHRMKYLNKLEDQMEIPCLDFNKHAE